MAALALSSPLAFALAAELEEYGGQGLPAGVAVALSAKRNSLDIEDAYGVTLTPTGGDILVSFDGGGQIRQSGGTTETHGPPLYALTVDVQAASAPVVVTVANSATLPEYTGAQKQLTWAAGTAVYAVQLPRSVTQPCSLVVGYRSNGDGTLAALCPATTDDHPSALLRIISTAISGRRTNNAGSPANITMGAEDGHVGVAALAIGASSTMTLRRRSVSLGASTTINSVSVTSSIDAALNFLVFGGLPTSGSLALTSCAILQAMVTDHEISSAEFANMASDQPRPWPQELDSRANCVEYLDFRNPRPWNSKFSGRPLTFLNVAGGASANAVMASASGSTETDFRPPNRLAGTVNTFAISSVLATSTLATADTGIHRSWTGASVAYLGAASGVSMSSDAVNTTAGQDFMYAEGGATRPFQARASACGSIAAAQVNFAPLRYDAPQYTYATSYSATSTILPITYTVSGATRNLNVTRPMSGGSIVKLSPQPILVFSHGKGGDKTDYSALRTIMPARGWCVVQPDHHDSSAEASGSTDAWEKRGAEFNELITRVASGEFCSTTAEGSRIVAGGHSFGSDTVQFCIGVTYAGSAATVGSVNPHILGAVLLSPTTQGDNRLVPSISSAYRTVGVGVVNLTGTQDTFGTDDPAVTARRRLHDNTPRKSWLSVLQDGNHGHGKFTDSPNFNFEYHDNIITGDIVFAACDYFASRRGPASKGPDWWLDNGIWQRLMPAQYSVYEVRESGATHYTMSPLASNRYNIKSGTTRLRFVSSADFYLNFGTADVVAGASHMYFSNTNASGETFNVPPTATHFAMRAVQESWVAGVIESSGTYRTY